jgi:hypothetical protein
VAARFGGRAARDAALETLRELETSSGEHDDLIEAERAELETTAQRRWALAPLGDRPAGRLLLERLDERRAEIARTLLLVVEVRVGNRAVGAVVARLGLARARALEALDALLPRGLARRVLPALEDGPADAGADPPTLDEAVRAELAGGDALARVLLVSALGGEGRAQLREAIRAAARAGADDLDPLRLIARVHAEKEEPDVPRSVDTMVFLHALPLFTELLPSQLAELAAACVWETVGAGEQVEIDGLVAVASGQVGEHGAGSVVGAAALFGEPAPAPLSTVEKSRILRLTRPAFERAVEDNPRIAIGICRALARTADRNG